MQAVGITNQIRVARDGQEAIQILTAALASADKDQSALPCLIVLDLKLPNEAGIDVLGWIRQQPASQAAGAHSERLGRSSRSAAGQPVGRNVLLH
jgi:CheY-like chemotaxis protein